MSNYKNVEKLLYNYKMMKIGIENMKQEIQHIKQDDGMTGIDYSGVSTSPTNEFNSSVEDTVLAQSEKIHYLERNIEYNKRQIEKVDKAMGGLSEIEMTVINERYLEGRQWWQVAWTANCSESTAKRYRRNAIQSLILGIYGEK